MSRLWVVEVRERGVWRATTWTAHTRANAREYRADLRRRYGLHKYRVRCYVPREGAK